MRCLTTLVVFVAFQVMAVSAEAQNARQMTVRLGSPDALEVAVQYHDPAELYARLKGSRVIPVWVSARNVSPRPVRLDYGDVRISVGDAGALVPLSPIDVNVAARELRRAANFGPVLGALVRQGAGWGANPFSRRLADGNLAPGQSKSGFVFFLRPPGLQFTGFMAIGTSTHPVAMLSTAVVKVIAPVPVAKPPKPGLDAAVRSGISGAAEKLMEALRIIWNGQPPFGKSYAVLFGISEYAFENDLKGVAQDLTSMSTYLEKDQQFDQVVVVANNYVTANTLRNVQQHLSATLRPEDRLLVYYAGHGTRSADGANGYLVLAANNGPAADRKTQVSMTEFMSWMRGLPVKHLLVMLDACYSGAAIGGIPRRVDSALDTANQEVLYRLSSEGGRFVITAGTESQLAHEHARWGGGLFTNAVLRALKTKDTSRPNNRVVTTYEMFTRVRRIMLDEVVKLGLTEQAPLIQDLGISGSDKVPRASKGEFVFVN